MDQGPLRIWDDRSPEAIEQPAPSGVNWTCRVRTSRVPSSSLNQLCPDGRNCRIDVADGDDDFKSPIHGA